MGKTDSPQLYSYVVDHDNGIAPCPDNDICTLWRCKYGSVKRKGLVESVRIGDWVVGTGGKSALSAGHGKLIYAMRVDEILLLRDYLIDARLKGRKDCGAGICELDKKFDPSHMLVLISRHYYYFGRNALEIPAWLEQIPLEKRGSGYRRDFPREKIALFAEWWQTFGAPGTKGIPHGNP